MSIIAILEKFLAGLRLVTGYSEPRPMQRKKLHQNYLILIRGLLDKHQKNLNDGISLINVAESGLNEQSGILLRLREILTVAGGAIFLKEYYCYCNNKFLS